MNLDKLAQTLEEQGGLLKLPLIKNKKTVRSGHMRGTDITPSPDEIDFPSMVSAALQRS